MGRWGFDFVWARKWGREEEGVEGEGEERRFCGFGEEGGGERGRGGGGVKGERELCSRQGRGAKGEVGRWGFTVFITEYIHTIKIVVVKTDIRALQLDDAPTYT